MFGYLDPVNIITYNDVKCFSCWLDRSIGYKRSYWYAWVSATTIVLLPFRCLLIRFCYPLLFISKPFGVRKHSNAHQASVLYHWSFFPAFKQTIYRILWPYHHFRYNKFTNTFWCHVTDTPATRHGGGLSYASWIYPTFFSVRKFTEAVFCLHFCDPTICIFDV